MEIIPQLKYYKLHENTPEPKIATRESACFDLHCCFDHVDSIAYWNRQNQQKKIGLENTRFLPKMQFMAYGEGKLDIQPGYRYLIPTGIIFDIPAGHSMRLHPRSGLALKEGLVLANCEGVIDSDYVQECLIMITNISDSVVSISNYDRICQAELIENQVYVLQSTDVKPVQRTDRIGGFGSTG